MIMAFAVIDFRERTRRAKTTLYTFFICIILLYIFIYT